MTLFFNFHFRLIQVRVRRNIFGYSRNPQAGVLHLQVKQIVEILRLPIHRTDLSPQDGGHGHLLVVSFTGHRHHGSITKFISTGEEQLVKVGECACVKKQVSTLFPYSGACTYIQNSL